MSEIRVPAQWAQEIFPLNPGNWLTFAAVYEVTCGRCGQPFTGRLHYMIGTGRENLPPGYGVRCPHCRAFNELSLRPR